VTTSYSQGERLVSQNVDVREVKQFLREPGKSLDEKASAAEVPTPLGGWKFKAEENEETVVEGDGEFRADGTFVLSHSEAPMKGRYAYANGTLWLIVEEGLVAITPSWDGKDRFTVKLGEAEMSFTRVPLKKTSAP